MFDLFQSFSQGPIFTFIQFSSLAQSCPTQCNPKNLSTPGLPVYHQLPEFPKLMSTESVMPFNHLILCHLLLLLPLIFPSIGGFLNEWALHIRWPNFWSFSFISPSNEYSGLIFFRMDWLDLLQSKGLSRVLQHQSSKASILQRSAFFIVQLSHPYMTTGKTIALARWTFVGRVMSLLLNMLSRLVITPLPRNKHLLIHGGSHHLQWFWRQKQMSVTVSIVSPSICHKVMRPDAMVLVF